MAILYDARGNEIRCGVPDTLTNETVTDARTISAALTSANAEVVMDLNGAVTATFDVRSIGSTTIVYSFEGTIDGSNYFALPAFANFQVIAAALVAEQYITSVTLAAQTHSGSYTVGVTGIRRVRLKVSAAAVTGGITVSSRASSADRIIYARPLPATLHVTATAAANAAATATLPAAGVGMFHYITSIQITRNATAALAGTATIIHTSTNLPGSPAWSVGNAMAAGGTQTDVVYAPATPLKSLLANTATTIVAAAGGAAVLGRVNVSYYVGF